MSHIVTINTEIRDPIALGLACQRRSLPLPINDSHTIFTTTVSGWGVQLPDWTYPVVCQAETGQLHFDNYGGRWGEQQHLDRLLQAYATEKATLEARRQGHTVTEQSLADGSIKLTIAVGSAA